MHEENPWQKTGSKEIYDNPWINLTEFQVLNPAGKPGIYGKVHFKNLAIGIVALDSTDQIVLVGQYRFPIDKYSWELPEGGGPRDRSFRFCKKRVAGRNGLSCGELV